MRLFFLFFAANFGFANTIGENLVYGDQKAGIVQFVMMLLLAGVIALVGFVIKKARGK